jgi:hypothetical protein
MEAPSPAKARSKERLSSVVLVLESGRMRAYATALIEAPIFSVISPIKSTGESIAHRVAELDAVSERTREQRSSAATGLSLFASPGAKRIPTCPLGLANNKMIGFG